VSKGKSRRSPQQRVADRTSRSYRTLIARFQAGHAHERERAAFWSRMRAAEIPAVTS